MNTHLQQFGDLIQKYPSEEHTIELIFKLFSDKKVEYALFGIYELTEPSSTFALTHILNYLVFYGYLQKKYRVISKLDNGGIEDFSKLQEIPDRIYDWRSEQEIEITPIDIKVIYKVSTN